MNDGKLCGIIKWLIGTMSQHKLQYVYLFVIIIKGKCCVIIIIIQTKHIYNRENCLKILPNLIWGDVMTS